MYAKCSGFLVLPSGCVVLGEERRNAPINSLFWKAPPERDVFFRLQVDES